MTTQTQISVVSAQLKKAVESGTKVISGKEWNYSSDVIPPIIIEGGDVKSAIYVEETFGPIIPLIPFRTEEEAIAAGSHPAIVKHSLEKSYGEKYQPKMQKSEGEIEYKVQEHTQDLKVELFNKGYSLHSLEKNEEIYFILSKYNKEVTEAIGIWMRKMGKEPETVQPKPLVTDSVENSEDISNQILIEEVVDDQAS
jgi:hypothetical protein